MRAWNGSVYSFLRKRGLGVRVDRQGVGEGVLDGGGPKGLFEEEELSEARDPWGGWVLRGEARKGAGA